MSPARPARKPVKKKPPDTTIRIRRGIKDDDESLDPSPHGLLLNDVCRSLASIMGTGLPKDSTVIVGMLSGGECKLFMRGVHDASEVMGALIQAACKFLMSRIEEQRISREKDPNDLPS